MTVTKRFKLTIENRTIGFLKESWAIAIVKSAMLFHSGVTVVNIVAPETVPQIITIVFDQEFDEEELEVIQAGVTPATALAVAAGVVALLGIIAAWNIEEVASIIPEVAGVFTSVTTLILVAFGAFLLINSGVLKRLKV